MDQNNKSCIKTVTLSLYRCFTNEDIIEVNIPINSIEILELDNICSKIIYLKDGHYDNVDKCGCLELKIKTENLDEKIINILSDNICIFTINIEFDNEIKHYNLPYNSDDGEVNNYQHINGKDNTIYILVNEK